MDMRAFHSSPCLALSPCSPTIYTGCPLGIWGPLFTAAFPVPRAVPALDGQIFAGHMDVFLGTYLRPGERPP